MNDPGDHAIRRPRQIRARGWKDIARRSWRKLSDAHVGLIAAGVGFYGLLALFPAIAALMAIGGLVLEPSTVTGQLERVSTVMPEAAASIVLDQARQVAGAGGSSLGLAALLSLVIALYSASRGVASLMQGLNIAYGEEEDRGFFRLLAVKLILTLALIVGVIMGLTATIILPAVLSILKLSAWAGSLIDLLRWAVLFIATVAGISLLYRFGPSRPPPGWRWLTPGALLATVAWLAASIGFSTYVEAFGTYNESFGTLAGVVVLLMWLWISAFVILLGAVLNAETETQVGRS